MASKNEVAAQMMEHLCKHEAHGYSQGARWGRGTETVRIAGKDYVIALGDRDCSSAVIDAWQSAGVPVKAKGASYTGNMRNAFVATGQFEWKPMSFTAQRGDIYLNEVNHTAMCTSPNPDQLAEFSISENGGIYGVEGDQTGWESRTGKPYYSYPWNGILHYIGTGEAIPQKTATTNPVQIIMTTATKEPSKKNGQPIYNAMVNGRWLDAMQGLVDSGGSGDDFAGEMGIGIQFLAIEGVGKYRVCTQNGGWLPFVSIRNMNDLDMGAAGDGSAIVAVEIPNSAIKYRVHTRGGGWLDWMIGSKDTGGSSDTYAGEMLPIDAIQIKKA